MSSLISFLILIAAIAVIFFGVKAIIDYSKKKEYKTTMKKMGFSGIVFIVLIMLLVPFSGSSDSNKKSASSNNKSSESSKTSSSSSNASSSSMNIYDKEAKEKWKKSHLNDAEKKQVDNWIKFQKDGLKQFGRDNIEYGNAHFNKMSNAMEIDMYENHTITNDKLKVVMKNMLVSMSKIYDKYKPISDNDWDGTVSFVNVNEQNIGSGNIKDINGTFEFDDPNK